MKHIVKYPMGNVKNQPVINIAGRDYVVMPYTSDIHIPAELVEFVKSHPEREDVNRVLQGAAEMIVQDVVRHIKDAIAVTIVERDWMLYPDRIDYDVFLPVLMPLDTNERWDGDWMEEEQRIRKECDERKQTGKPYIFKIGKKEEEGMPGDSHLTEIEMLKPTCDTADSTDDEEPKTE